MRVFLLQMVKGECFREGEAPAEPQDAWAYYVDYTAAGDDAHSRASAGAPRGFLGFSEMPRVIRVSGRVLVRREGRISATLGPDQITEAAIARNAIPA